MLTVAYISPGGYKKACKKLSPKAQLHADALALVANAKIKDREKAVRLFGPEIAEVESLQRRLAELRSANPNLK